MKGTRKLWWGIIGLILLSPIGLILPEVFESGPAWGEWSLEEIEKMIGFVPAGLKRIADLWSAPIPDYNFKSYEGKGLAHSSVAYIFSGALGAGLIILFSFFVGKFLSRKNRD
jgi:hypothetical protein